MTAGTPARQASIARAVAALAVAGVVLRVLVCFVLLPAWEARTGAPQYPDKYPALARSLLDRGTLGYAPDGAETTTARGPGFPAWIALGMRLGGEDPRWLGLWSGLPMLVLGPILAGAAWRRYGPLPALAGFAVTACHPIPSLLVSRVMSEEFYSACGFGAALLWARALRSAEEPRGRWLAALAGSLVATQMLTRSTGILTLVVLLAVGAVLAPRRPALLALLAVTSLLPAIVWSVRSSRLEGRPVFVHSLAGYNFWVGEAFDRFGSGWTSGDGWGRSIALIAEKGGLDPEAAPRFHYTKLSPRELAAFDGRLVRAAGRRIVEDPLGYLARVARGIPRFWIEAQSPLRTFQNAISVLPLLLLALLGVSARRRLPGSPDMLLAISVLLIVAHNLAYAATLPMARMSVQIYPSLAWLCVAGAARALTMLRRGSTRAESGRDVSRLH